jgi:hypothetical protein
LSARRHRQREYRPITSSAFPPEAGLVEIDARGRPPGSRPRPEADLRQAATALASHSEIQNAADDRRRRRARHFAADLVAAAARATGARSHGVDQESVRGHGKRHPFRIRHRLAADATGRLTAAAIDILADAGCYASTSAAVIDNAVSQACGPYAVDDVLVTGRAVYTNNPYTCAMRGFGVNQVAFAMEQQMS